MKSEFVYAKAKNVPTDKRGTFGYGDVWTWVALDADSKLVLSWRLGPRDAGTAYDLMQDLAARVATHVQITTDGHRVYLDAVEDAFGSNVDYAMLQNSTARTLRKRVTVQRRSSACGRRS